MKIGVPTFGYRGSVNLASRFAQRGHYSTNLGDNMQSIAIRLLLGRLGVPDDDIVSIDRDDLDAYEGPPVVLLMNGVFPARCFPLPARITPLFVGLCVTEKTVVLHRRCFLDHQPIGCRDTDTAMRFRKHGIDAFVSGCLTMTLPQRDEAQAASARRTLVIYGAGDGAFPASALSGMPAALLEDAEFVSQRVPAFEFPLDEAHRARMEGYARSLLDHYAAEARLVVTSLHHAAAPCMALGIPVVICRQQADSRFSYLAQLTRVHLPADFQQIDWSPRPVDLTGIKPTLEALVRQSIEKL